MVIELKTQPDREMIFQAADYLALVFERLGVLDAKFEGEKGDHKAVVGRRLSVVGQTAWSRDETF